MVNWGDPAGAQPGGEDSTAGEVIVKDAENVTRTLSHNVSSSAVRTRYDPRLERVEVALTQEIDADYMRVDFGGDATARARLNEKGDRVVLGSSDLWLSGEAEDLTRQLYAEGAFEGGPGGFSGVSYGDEVNVTVSAVEEGVGEVVFEETETLGHGEVNAQVDYLFDSTENQLRVVYASNVNADHVDVTFSLGGNISKVRLHNPGDEARISSDYGKVETLGSAENLMRKEIADAVRQYDRYRDEEVNLSDVADEAGGALSDVGSYDDIQNQIDSLKSQSSLSDEQQSRLSALMEARRELRVTEAGSLSLEELKETYLDYVGQVEEMDDVDSFDSLLNDNVFDNDVLSEQGQFLTDDDDNIPDVSQSYDRPTRGELLSVRAVAKVEREVAPSGIRRRAGVQTEVLDVSGEFRDGGYTELGGSVNGDPITVTSESSGFSDGSTVSETVGSLDTEAIADRVAEAANRLRADTSGYTPELERTHGMDKAAQEHADRMENNIDESEEINAIRSGDIPADTNERNRIQRYIRNAATACHTGGETNSLYTQGSYVALTDDVEGIIERTSVSTTTVNTESMAPVTVPNYALPLSEAYIYDAWTAGGENVAAFSYTSLVESGAIDRNASTAEVADAILESPDDIPEDAPEYDGLLDRGSFTDTMTDSSYEHHGIGVAVDDDTGVIYVTQSFC